MARPEAVLFDVDGTLVDSVDLHAQAWQEALRKFGKDVPVGDVRRQIGKGGDQLLPVFLSREELERDGEALDRFRAELWRREYMPRVRPFPGASALVRRAHGAGFRVALASSGKEDEVAHNRRLLGIDDVLHGPTTSDHAERSKPHPDIFEAALARVHAAPERAVAVGDSPWDALAARRAGVRAVGLLSGGFAEQDLRDAGCVAITPARPTCSPASTPRRSRAADGRPTVGARRRSTAASTRPPDSASLAAQHGEPLPRNRGAGRRAHGAERRGPGRGARLLRRHLRPHPRSASSAMPSLTALGVAGDALVDEGLSILNWQMVGMLVGGIAVRHPRRQARPAADPVRLHHALLARDTSRTGSCTRPHDVHGRSGFVAGSASPASSARGSRSSRDPAGASCAATAR